MRKLSLTIALLAMAVSVAVSSAGATTTSIVHVSAAVSGMRYEQKTLRAHHGRIKIVFLNRSSIKHNVNIESGENELGKTATIRRGTTTAFVTLKAGKYNFYCSVPGHEDAGMHGTLVVS